jgi:drug/metabolite transporter (DMT)-like permease
MKRPGQRLGFALVSASAVAWSTAGLFTRLIAADSWTMLAWRGILGALGLALVISLMPSQGTWRSLRRLGPLGWFFVLQSSAGMIFFLTALRATTVAHVAVIYATVPFIAAALSWLAMRERPTTGAVVSSLIALAGVAVMVGFGRDGGVRGDLLALGMTFTMAVAMVVARHFPDMPFLPASCMSALLSGLIAMPFGAPLSVTAHDVVLLMLFGLTTFALGLPLFTLGARLLPAIETALIGALDAPLAPLWVWLAFKEKPSSITLIGGAIVFAAVGIHLVWDAATANAASAIPRAAVAE